MAAMRLPKIDPSALQRTLLNRYGIEIPCFEWQDQSIVRVSAQGYNTAAEMERLVAALSDLLPLAHAA